MAINQTYSKLVLICSTGRHFRNATFEREALDFCFSIVSVSAAILREGLGVWKCAHVFSATSAIIICDITSPANLV